MKNTPLETLEILAKSTRETVLPAAQSEFTATALRRVIKAKGDTYLVPVYVKSGVTLIAAHCISQNTATRLADVLTFALGAKRPQYNFSATQAGLDAQVPFVATWLGTVVNCLRDLGHALPLDAAGPASAHVEPNKLADDVARHEACIVSLQNELNDLAKTVHDLQTQLDIIRNMHPSITYPPPFDTPTVTPPSITTPNTAPGPRPSWSAPEIWCGYSVPVTTVAGITGNISGRGDAGQPGHICG